MVEEARLEQNESGLAPAGDGWFVVNVRDAAWIKSDGFGSGCRFDSPDAPFADYGINVRVLSPGQPCALYHAEPNQESILVLEGEGLLLVEGEERPLRRWDFVHLPPHTEHVLLGAGDGPCVVLMAGGRQERRWRYPVSEAAQRHGAGVDSETESPAEAYAPYEGPRLERPDGWDSLPWA